MGTLGHVRFEMFDLSIGKHAITIDQIRDLSNAQTAHRKYSNGGPPGDRTQDTVIKSHVLYH